MLRSSTALVVNLAVYFIGGSNSHLSAGHTYISLGSQVKAEDDAILQQPYLSAPSTNLIQASQFSLALARRS